MAAASAAGIKRGRHDGAVDGVVGLARCDGVGQRVGLSCRGAAPDGCWPAGQRQERDNHPHQSPAEARIRSSQARALSRTCPFCLRAPDRCGPPPRGAAPLSVPRRRVSRGQAGIRRFCCGFCAPQLLLSEGPPVRDIDRRQFVQHQPSPDMTRPKVPPEQRQRTAQACEVCKRRKQKVSQSPSRPPLAQPASTSASASAARALPCNRICIAVSPAKHRGSFSMLPRSQSLQI